MRLFVALLPPNGCLPKIAQAAIPLQDALGVKVLPADNWHITLKFLGETEEGRMREIEGALGKVKFRPFIVQLAGAGAFPNNDYPRAIWIGGKSAECVELAEKIESELSSIGFPREGKKFSVHLTVARSKSAGDIAEFLRKTGEVCSFGARTFVLMRSKLLPQGAAYEVLREFGAEEG